MGKSKKIFGKDLLVNNEGAKRYLSEVEQSDKYEIRLLPEGFTLQTDTAICGDTVSLFAYDSDNNNWNSYLGESREEISISSGRIFVRNVFLCIAQGPCIFRASRCTGAP